MIEARIDVPETYAPELVVNPVDTVTAPSFVSSSIDAKRTPVITPALALSSRRAARNVWVTSLSWRHVLGSGALQGSSSAPCQEFRVRL